MQKSLLYQMKRKRNIIRRVAVPVAAVFCCGMSSTDALTAPTPPCGPGRTLPAKTWLMTAPSCEPSPADLASQYSDDLGGPYDTDWLSFRWNSAPTAQNYVKQAGTDSLVLGTGNWLYSYKAGTLLLEGTATTTVPCSDYGSGLVGNCFAIDLTPSSSSNLWQIIGHPFPYTVSWADVRVAASSDGTSWTQYTPSQAATANLMAKEYWFWNGSSYQTKDDSTPGSIGVLQPQESIWVRIKSGSSSLNADNFKLLIPSSSDNWTVIGKIPEYSFSSEPLIDENTAFTMNVDPSDPLMLTAVTTNGWTVEYFAAKDQMGAPVFLTGIYAQHDTTGEYLDVQFDEENRPVSVEQQGDKKVVLNWENYTVYGEKEWTIVGELPDFSSITPPVVNDQAEILTNTNPADPLWLTVTTTDDWVVKYFARKDSDGSPMNMTFIHAANNSTGDVVMAEIDEYGQPSRISKQDGKIMKVNWQPYTLTVEEGGLQPPDTRLLMAIQESSSQSSSSTCTTAAKTAYYGCFSFALLPVPILKQLLGFDCRLSSILIEEAQCNNNSTNPNVVACKTVSQVVGAAVSIGSLLGGPLTIFLGQAVGAAVNAMGNVMCEPWFGNSTGDPHIYTPDRLKYDFQAVGEFIYLQSTQDPTEMTIQIRQGAWRNSKNIAGNTAVAMSVGGDVVEINVANTPRLSINNAPVTMIDKEVKQLKNGCKIYAETQRKYWIIWKDNSMAEVKTYNNHLDISVSLPDNRKGLVRGLLGNSDGDKTNDLQTRDGSKTFDISTELTKDELYNQFGNSWRITQEESLFTYAEGEDTATYTDLNFPYELVKASDLSETVRANAEQTCRNAGITDPILLEDCILDVGMTGDATFADNMTDLTPPEQSITVTDGWMLYENAQKIEGEKIIRITPDAAWQTGMALREGALNLDGSFEKTFNIYMGDNDNGADGMVFIMLPELPPAGTSLNGGEGLGFSSACNNKPCLGVEIDTYRNSSDPSEDHIALVKNGSVNHNDTDNQALPSVPLTFNIEDDAPHTLTVSWNKESQVFSVLLDGNTVFTHKDLDLKTLLGTSTASYGFVGSTGTMTSEQYFYPVISYKNNLLKNPGFELGLDDWITDNAIRTDDPTPHSGINYLGGIVAATTHTYQTVDLAAKVFTVEDIDSGKLTAKFGGWQSGYKTQEDRGKIEVTFNDGTSDLGSFDLGWFYSNHTWTLKENTVTIPSGTRFVTYHFYTERTEGNNCDGYLDDAFLVIQ